MKAFPWRRAAHRTPVDAVAQLDAHADTLEGDRGRPRLDGVARPMAPGAKAFLTLLLVLGVLIAALLVLRVLRSDTAEETASSLQARIENVLPDLKLAMPSQPPAEPQAPEPPPPPATVPELAQAPRPALGPAPAMFIEDPIEQRRLTGGLQGERDNQGAGNASASSPAAAPRGDTGPMADKLQPLRLNAAQASVMGNRDLLLTQGAMIDCVQQTRFVSAQAGMITCYATREVRSASGRVVLIDAGTMFTGYQQSVLAHGQPRIGVVWSRLQTPQGVVVHLDSPATGPLGEAGLDGQIDSHFAERFGAAIMISLIDDVGNWLSSRSGNQGSGGFRFDNSGDAAQQAVATVLDNTINIPPTLYRNQGERVGIYVARDLDFSSVYTLEPARPVATRTATGP